MQNSNLFLSIIIPVYNVEKYIDECINSVLLQKMLNYEIILVDDGSPDNCPKICDNYSQKYNFIKTIHKKNGGLSEARNVGIDNASGEYIIFLDSDDLWNKNVNINEMLNRVRKNPNIEMFLFNSLEYYENEGLYISKENQNLSKIRTDTIYNYYHDLLMNGNLEVSAGTKILKKEFIINNKLYFKKGIKSEDNEWIIRLLRTLNSVEIIDEPLYLYRQGREDSITHNIKKQNIIDLLNIIKSCIDYSNNNKNIFLELEYCFCSYLWFSALGLTYNLTKKERKEIKDLFKLTNKVCKYSISKKTKIANYVYLIFGLKITSSILGLYIKMKIKRQFNKIMVSKL